MAAYYSYLSYDSQDLAHQNIGKATQKRHIILVCDSFKANKVIEII